MLLFLLSLKTIYKPPFKRNHKENAYFARLDKGKSSDVDVEVSKPMSKPPIRKQKKKKKFLCLLVIFVVLLVTLDQIVLC